MRGLRIFFPGPLLMYVCEGNQGSIQDASDARCKRVKRDTRVHRVTERERPNRPKPPKNNQRAMLGRYAYLVIRKSCLLCDGGSTDDKPARCATCSTTRGRNIDLSTRPHYPPKVTEHWAFPKALEKTGTYLQLTVCSCVSLADFDEG